MDTMMEMLNSVLAVQCERVLEALAADPKLAAYSRTATLTFNPAAGWEASIFCTLRKRPKAPCFRVHGSGVSPAAAVDELVLSLLHFANRAAER